MRAELTVSQHRKDHNRQTLHPDEMWHDFQKCACGQLLAGAEKVYYMRCCGRRLHFECMK